MGRDSEVEGRRAVRAPGQLQLVLACAACRTCWHAAHPCVLDGQMTRYQRLTAAEVNVASPLGAAQRSDGKNAPTHGSTRAALDRVATESVTGGPCYVLFSGGRDSSLVLALATRAARDNGVPDPIPVTAVYPGDEDADEREWQRLVLDHLEITEQVVISVTDERSTLGELATTHLR